MTALLAVAHEDKTCCPSSRGIQPADRAAVEWSQATPVQTDEVGHV